jgi:hypothetical protein
MFVGNPRNPLLDFSNVVCFLVYRLSVRKTRGHLMFSIVSWLPCLMALAFYFCFFFFTLLASKYTHAFEALDFIVVFG